MVQTIWDLYLVYGWNALLAIAMFILDSSQIYVLGKNIEETNDYFTWEFSLNSEDFKEEVLTYMSKVEVVQKLL